MSRARILLLVVLVAVLILSVVIYRRSFPRNDLGTADVNRDGVWDDLEPYIAAHAKTEEQTKILRTAFEIMQREMLKPETGRLVRDGIAPEYTPQFVACIGEMHDSDPKFPDIEALEDAIVNTPARAAAYIKFNAQASGSTFELWDEDRQGNPCPLDNILRGQ